MAALPRNTVRLRLTAVYGVLVLLSGLALLGATYVLVRQSVEGQQPQSIGIVTINDIVHSQDPTGIVPSGMPSTVPTDLPTSLPTSGASPPPEVVEALNRRIRSLVNAESDRVLKRLLVSSGIALAGMLALSIAVGWLVAGRILRPLRAVTAAVHTITHDDLHRRLNATGPQDEIKELSDTFDRLLDRLEASFEAQRRFVANASHELRTPLARQRVIGQVVLAEPNPSVTDLIDAHHQILETGAEQAQILDAMLTLARGQQRPETLVRCDLADVARRVLDRCATGDLVVTHNLGSAPIAAHVNLVERLVTNLIDNAAAYNVPAGRIHLETTGGIEHPVLTVTNTGPQIPADQIPGLLEPFRRGGTDRIHHGRGLGLGLSIVAAISDSHGATLTLAPGVHGGLVVTVAFPPLADGPTGPPVIS